MRAEGGVPHCIYCRRAFSLKPNDDRPWKERIPCERSPSGHHEALFVTPITVNLTQEDVMPESARRLPTTHSYISEEQRNANAFNGNLGSARMMPESAPKWRAWLRPDGWWLGDGVQAWKMSQATAKAMAAYLNAALARADALEEELEASYIQTHRLTHGYFMANAEPIEFEQCSLWVCKRNREKLAALAHPGDAP